MPKTGCRIHISTTTSCFFPFDSDAQCISFYTTSCHIIQIPFLHRHSRTHVEGLSLFTYTLLSVRDMASSVKASLDTSLSLVLLTGAKEPTWQGLNESPLLYDLWRMEKQRSD